MKKFKKKPVVIEAVEWTGSNLREVIDFTGLHESALKKWTWDEYLNVVSRDGLKIFTLEGPMMASPGDWIIKGIKGEFYPCKPDIFESTYDEVTDLTPPPSHKSTDEPRTRIDPNSIALRLGIEPQSPAVAEFDRDAVLMLIRDWKHAWMKDDYRKQIAFGIDSNMTHHLADLLFEKMRKGER